jgi:UDP-glucose 4-epimerase
MDTSGWNGTRVLITGGLGFIGSNIAQACRARGAAVTILDACLDPYGWNFANIKEIKDDVRFVRGDVRDFDTVKSLVETADIIFDCAAQVSHTISVKEPFLDLDINARGALTVLEACRRANPAAKVVYASTRGVIGRRRFTPITEEHPTEPTDLNGIHKLAVEKYAALYNRLYSVRTSCLRISNTFGPRSQMRNDDYGVINWFIRRALREEPIVIHGEGLQTRDYNYVDDVTEAFLLAAKRPEADGEAFMLGCGVETSLIDMIRMILEETGRDMPIVKIPRPAEREAIEIGNYGVSIEKAQRLLGWTPRIDAREGIRRTVEFYRERMEEYL